MVLYELKNNKHENSQIYVLSVLVILLLSSSTKILAEPVYCGDAGSVYFQADVNQDCEVSLKDLARLDPWGDFSHDDENHLDDFLNIVEMWLECSDPCVLRCGTFAEILARKERSDVDLWLSQHFTSRHPQPGFSFFYDGFDFRRV